LALGGVQHVETGALVNIDVGDDDWVTTAVEALDGFTGCGDGVHRIALFFERGQDRKLQCRIVFDE
jgi:hypothetical protein